MRSATALTASSSTCRNGPFSQRTLLIHLTIPTAQDEPHRVRIPLVGRLPTRTHPLLRLDSIGIAGFGHDFQSLDGASSSVSDVFESFDRDDTGLISHLIFLLGPVLPYLLKLPTEQNRIFRKMRVAMGEIADELLARTRKEKEGGLAGKAEEKSVIGLLSKAPLLLRDARVPRSDGVFGR